MSSSGLTRLVFMSPLSGDSASSSAFLFISLPFTPSIDTLRGGLPRSSVIATAAIMAMRSSESSLLDSAELTSSSGSFVVTLEVSSETQRGDDACGISLGIAGAGACGGGPPSLGTFLQLVHRQFSPQKTEF